MCEFLVIGTASETVIRKMPPNGRCALWQECESGLIRAFKVGPGGPQGTLVPVPSPTPHQLTHPGLCCPACVPGNMPGWQQKLAVLRAVVPSPKAGAVSLGVASETPFESGSDVTAQLC